MNTYQAPIDDMMFVIDHLAGLGELRQLAGLGDLDAELVGSILDEGGRFAAEVLQPLNFAADRDGARIEGSDVRAPKGFAEAYRQYVDGGWNSLCSPENFGGQGLPLLLSFAVDEMWNSANMSFALCPMLSQAGVEALDIHGSEVLQNTYLAKMVSGEWTGTMDLTEPQAGSDLAALRCKAVPNGDHYLISGQKIYITWGDHQMTDNIIHMVLARLPDAPEGVRGISLFLVPKYLVNEDGSLGERNDMRPVSIEEKMGIHGSPTCVMGFGEADGAIGYLVGAENKGLACMFTMMNNARLKVGLEGVGIAEGAYQRARAYARDRVQGSSPDQPGRVTIVHHPDVRRMLMLMKSQTEAMRALAYCTAAASDRAQRSEDKNERAVMQARVDLLVPIVKAWSTEQCQEVASLGVQVHGGMGFIEETGAAQYFRDARITTIYEGTTGIQSQDLAGRKILRDEGKAAASLIEDMRATASELATVGETDMAASLNAGVDAAASGIKWLLDNYSKDAHAPNAVCVNLLMLMGTVACAWQMGRAALAAHAQLRDKASNARFYDTKLVTARFFHQHVLPRAHANLAALEAGSETIMALAEDQF